MTNPKAKRQAHEEKECEKKRISITSRRDSSSLSNYIGKFIVALEHQIKIL